MGKIISSYVFPHPPIIVPEVGRGGENGALKTVEAARKAAIAIKGESPSTIIVTTPHGPVFQDYVHISTSGHLTGDLGKFGSADVNFKFDNNIPLVEDIIAAAKREDIFAGGLDDSLIRKYRISTELDHGALVPLYYIAKEYDAFKLVHISIAGLPFRELYRFGMCISEAVRRSDENVVFLASGDLSHRLAHDAPYGYNRRGQEFDERVVEGFKHLDVTSLMDIDEGLCESAGECGLRSFIMMFGALDGYEVKPEVYSYEGPFGVGYSVARFALGQPSPERKIWDKLIEEENSRMQDLREKEDPYVALARKALETYVLEGKVIEAPGNLPDEMVKGKAGTFVSIKKHRQLRGCIGTIVPTRKSIALEIINNAISSGTQDPRFDPIMADELDDLVYSVDVLKEAEPIDSMEELDVLKYGVIVRAGSRSGLLLPNLEGVDTPEEQVSIALQKAGIRPGEKYSMERFEVIRHK